MERENYQMHGQAPQDLFCWTKGRLTDIHGPGGDLRGNKQPQDPTMYGQICGSTCLMQRKAKRSKSGLSRNRSSIMPEEYVSSSLNQMMNNFNTPWKTLVESWKFRCQQQCFVKHQQSAAVKLAAVLGTQDQICLYCRCRRIFDNTIGRCAAQVSRRSHLCERNKFIEPIHFGAEVYSDASSIKNTGCEGCSGKRMGKLEKIPAWQLTKVRSKKEVIEEARNKGRKVHFASLMDLCHLKNSELEPPYQKYQGRVVLRGDIVKDDSGSYAVFTEQGSSASQTTAAKVMDIISRLPGCAGQAADAVSAYTQVKMEDAPTLLKIPKSEFPDIWMRLPKHKWPKSGLIWERQFEKVLLKHGWEKVPNCECLLANREKAVLVCVCGWHKTGWEGTKHWPSVENSHKRSWFGRANIVTRPWLFGVHSKRMSDQQGHHSRPKPIRTISGLLELISRFEFDFRRFDFFLNDSIFLVCSKFNHRQCFRTCAYAVACLYPHNSISNVMVSLTIHDTTYTYIYKRCLQKKYETIVEGQRLFKLNIMESVWRANRSLYLGFVCLCVSVCCVLLWCRSEGERRRRETNRTIWLLIPARTSLKIAETALSGKPNDWRNREHVVLDPFSNWKCIRSKGFFGELGSSDNASWANFGKQNWRCHFACSVLCVVRLFVVRCVCCWCTMCWCRCWCVTLNPLPPRSKSWKDGMACLQPHFIIRKLSIVRESTDENMTTPWIIWTWIWPFGAYFWMPLFEQQFILDQKMRRIYNTWRITSGTVWTFIPWNWKTDQWTKRNHWCRHFSFRRCYVDVDKLILWEGLTDHQRESLRLLRLCALCVKNGRWSYCDLEEQN